MSPRAIDRMLSVYDGAKSEARKQGWVSRRHSPLRQTVLRRSTLLPSISIPLVNGESLPVLHMEKQA